MTPRRLFLAMTTTAILFGGTALAASPSAWTRATPDGSSAASASAWTRAAPPGQPLTAKPSTVAASRDVSPASASASVRAAPAHRHRNAYPEAYRSEASAESACGGAIVWHARHSHVVHGPRSHWWDNTKGGAFMCQKAALAAGLKLSRY